MIRERENSFHTHLKNEKTLNKKFESIGDKHSTDFLDALLTKLPRLPLPAVAVAFRHPKMN